MPPVVPLASDQGYPHPYIITSPSYQASSAPMFGDPFEVNGVKYRATAPAELTHDDQGHDMIVTAGDISQLDPLARSTKTTVVLSGGEMPGFKLADDSGATIASSNWRSPDTPQGHLKREPSSIWDRLRSQWDSLFNR